jgi:hypothetical protein
MTENKFKTVGCTQQNNLPIREKKNIVFTREKHKNIPGVYLVFCSIFLFKKIVSYF